MKMKINFKGKCIICKRNLRNHHVFCDKHWDLMKKINDRYANQIRI